MNIFTEKLLLSRIKNNDRTACEKLIKNHYKKVYYFIYKLCREREIAQDLTQETFVKVWKKIETFDGNSRILTWLFRIAYNVFIDYQRANNKLNTLSMNDPETLLLPDGTDCVDDKVSSNLSHQKVIESMNKLSPKLKEIIILHYEEDLPYSDICKILEIPKGTVKSRLNAALNELRKNLSKNKL